MSISVIIPCYNCGRWVARALESVAAQTRPPDQIIVVDDGSEDDSIAKVKSVNVPVVLLHTCRANAAGARNVGIQHATGEWIAFLDADDQWLPHHLSQALSLLEGSNDVAYFAAARYQLTDGSPASAARLKPTDKPGAGLLPADFLSWHGKTNSFCNCTVVARRDRIRAVGGFDVELPRRHDVELFLRLIATHTWAYHPCESAIIQRDTPGSISRSQAECDYYSLCALRKHRHSYGGLQLEGILSRRARTAVSSALLSGNREVQASALRVAWGYLGPWHRLFYAFMPWIPSVLRCMLRTKRYVWRCAMERPRAT